MTGHKTNPTKIEKEYMVDGLVRTLQIIKGKIKPQYRACPDCSGYGGCSYGACQAPNPPSQDQTNLSSQDHINPGPNKRSNA